MLLPSDSGAATHRTQARTLNFDRFPMDSKPQVFPPRSPESLVLARPFAGNARERVLKSCSAARARSSPGRDDTRRDRHHCGLGRWDHNRMHAHDFIWPSRPPSLPSRETTRNLWAGVEICGRPVVRMVELNHTHAYEWSITCGEGGAVGGLRACGPSVGQ